MSKSSRYTLKDRLEQIEESNPLFSSTNRISGLIRPAFNPNRLRFVIIARRSGGKASL